MFFVGMWIGVMVLLSPLGFEELGLLGLILHVLIMLTGD